MKLIDALGLLTKPVKEGALPFRVFLACGFTPLHLQTFLAARLRQLLPNHTIAVDAGIFGDLVGNLERLEPAIYDVVPIIVEWQDLDPRLGIRSLSGWQSTDLPDIIESVNLQITRLQQALAQTSPIPTSVCMPTLPLPPLFHNPMHQWSAYELQLRRAIASFAEAVSNDSHIRVVNSQCLDELSPPNERFDVKSEIMAGFPYTCSHASKVAELLACLIHNPGPKKGLITDLDDTLWAGILGEVGVGGISWNLERHTHMHAVYQQFLASLGSAGILVGIASKNDPALVEQAFDRKDLLLPKGSVFPFEIHWFRKSESVRRILETWNVGAESVVFIDDSPMEVAEVKAAFPDMECIVFQKNKYDAIWELLKRLRNLFGKTSVTQEDSLRLQSIRDATALRESLETPGGSLNEFLQRAEASILFSCDNQSGDTRALELLNKTNQFNLNGRRFSESDWMNYLQDPAAFLVTATYKDKYGPLGKIAILLGRVENTKVSVDAWVMSCRAFSRRVEHQCLKFLFDKFDATEIVFSYQPTIRNGPIQQFFQELLGFPPDGRPQLTRAEFLVKTPDLFHCVEEVVND